MRIIKHGNVMRFKCDACGCEFVANKDECKKQPKYSECMMTGTYEYYYHCPECGKRIQGHEVRAPEVNDNGDGPEEHKA